jgi:hypothetical protein
MIPNEYAREALKRGLAYEEELGVNPFKFGMIGSTDSHTSLATRRGRTTISARSRIVEPGTADPTATRTSSSRRSSLATRASRNPALRNLASGLAGVWARENTREAIWDAFMRKEVYATTGSRITVRVFAGWDFEGAEVQRPDFARRATIAAFRWGATSFTGPEAAAPTFIVRALRDPDGANLDRIQIVKGWVDGDGNPKTEVFDVAWSGDRELQADGKLPRSAAR